MQPVPLNQAETGRRAILSNQLLGNWECSPGIRGVLINMLEQGIEGDRKEKADLRRYLLAFLFADRLGLSSKAISSKLLTSPCWFALNEWIKPTKDQETGVWRPDNINFFREMWIMTDKAREIREEARRREAEILGQLGFL